MHSCPRCRSRLPELENTYDLNPTQCYRCGAQIDPDTDLDLRCHNYSIDDSSLSDLELSYSDLELGHSEESTTGFPDQPWL